MCLLLTAWPGTRSRQHCRKKAAFNAGKRLQGALSTARGALSTARGTHLLGAECTAYVPNCSKTSTSEPSRIWLGKDNSCCELPTQMHLPSLWWFLASHQNGNGQGWQLGVGPVTCQRKNRGVLAIKGHPSLGCFLKRTLSAWNWLKSWTAARTAHPRCRPVAS